MEKKDPLTINTFIEDIDSFLVFPDVGFEVNRMAKDGRYSAIDIANEISKDPFISAQVLRLANSAYYQFPSSIDSLPRAVAVIGTNDLCNLVLMLSTVGAFRAKELNGKNSEYIWRHSLFVGLVARELARHVEGQLFNKDRLFIAGVLHEIGRIIFAIKCPDEFDFLIAKEQQSKDPFYRMEQKQFGVAHHSVSATIMRMWQFPETLTKIIENQCALDAAGSVRGEVAILLLANKISEDTGLGSAGIDEEPLSIQCAREICNIEDNAINRATEDARHMYFSLLPSFMHQRSA